MEIEAITQSNQIKTSDEGLRAYLTVMFNCSNNSFKCLNTKNYRPKKKSLVAMFYFGRLSYNSQITVFKTCILKTHLY